MTKRPDPSGRKGQFSEKLRDPRWQKLRLKILERDEWCCQRCFDGESTLNVHHRNYLPGKEPWDSPVESLVTLCERCHEHEMAMRSEIDQRLLCALRKNFFYRDLEVIAGAIEEMSLLHVPEVVADVYAWALTTPEVQRKLIEWYFNNLKKEKAEDGRKSEKNETN